MKQCLASVSNELRQAAELISRSWLSWFQFLIVLGLLGLLSGQLEASQAGVGQADQATGAGLDLRVVASGISHPQLFKEALADLDQGKIAKEVLGPSGELWGLWVPIDRKEANGQAGDYRWLPGMGQLVRESGTSRLVDFSLMPIGGSPEETSEATAFLDGQGIAGLEVLVVVDSFQLEPGQLHSLEASFDELGRPCLNFQLSGEAAKSFYLLTQSNVGQFLAIIVGGRLISAPSINSAISGSGKISGDFTESEIAEKLRLIDPTGRLSQTPFSFGSLFARLKWLLVPTVFGFIVIGMSVHYFFRRRTLLREAELEKDLTVALPARDPHRDFGAED